MKGKENECAAVRLGKSRLMVAMAILAVAFVVLAAVPAASTDDQSEGAGEATVILTETDGVTYQNSTGAVISGKTTTSSGSLTIKVAVDAGYEVTDGSTKPVVYVDGVAASATADESSPYTFSNIITGKTTGISIIKVTGVTAIKYSEKHEYGEIKGTTYDAKQNVIIDEDSTIVSGTMLVNGKLTVPEGVTLTVENGAQLTMAIADIRGTIVIKYSGVADLTNADISGSVQADGSLTVKATSILTGAMTVGEGGSIQGAIVVAESGVLTVGGEIAEELNITSGGTVIIDSEIPAGGATTINMNADGAVVQIKKYADSDTSSKTITINDAGTVLPAYKQVAAATITQTNEVTVSITTSAGETGVVSGLVVKQVVGMNSAGTAYEGRLQVSGDVQFSAVNDTPTTVVENSTYAGIAMNGQTAVEIPENLTIGAGVSLSNTDGNLDISADLDVSAPAVTADEQATYQTKAAAGFTIAGGNVTMLDGGIVASSAKITVSSGAFNAVGFSVKENDVTTFYYSSLETALQTVDASAGAIKALTLTGKLDMTSEGTIPAKVTLTMEAGSILNIENTAELNLAEGGKFVATGATVNVTGILYAEDGNDVTATTEISADVSVASSSTSEPWARWTGLAIALAEAESGDVITASRAVSIDSDLSIPDGVTLIFEDTNKLTIGNNVTLTVDGVLKSDEAIGGNFAATATTDKAAIAMGTGCIFLKSSEFGYSVSAVAGAYYGVNYDGIPYYAISTVRYANEINDDIISSIALYGTVTEDFEFTGGIYNSKIWIASGSKLIGDITLNDSWIEVLKSAAGIQATIRTNGAAINIEGEATSQGVLQIISNEGGLELVGYVKGQLEVLTGKVQFGNQSQNLNFSSATDIKIREGATGVFAGTTQPRTIICEGGFVVPENGGATGMNLDLYGNATLRIDPDVKTVQFTTLRVGASASGIFEGATVTVTGKVGLTAKTGVMYASPNATIDAKSVEGLRSTQYYIGTQEIMTVYGPMDSTVNISTVTYAPIENGYFNGAWVDADGNTTSGKIGDRSVVYPVVAEDIYSVTITAQTGISDILMGGKLMEKTNNVFTLTGLTPGHYTVVAKGADGQTVDSVLTIDGKVVANNVLTASGIATTDEGIAYTGQLTIASEPVAKTYVVVFDETEVTVTADGQLISPFDNIGEGAAIAIALDGGVEGKILVNGGEYGGEFALNGNIQITVKAGSEPLSPSENMIVSIKSADDGKIYVIVTALDGGYIPAGVATIQVNYTYYEEELGIWVSGHDVITTNIPASEEAYLPYQMDISGAEHIVDATGLLATFVVDGGDSYSSDVTTYEYSEA